MEFSFDDDQRAVSDLAERLFAEHGSDAAIHTGYGAQHVFDAKLWARLAETGLLSLAIPSADGGSALGMLEVGLVLEQQGRRLCPVPLWRHQLGAAMIASSGSDRLRRELLPDLLGGTRIVSIASEPNVALGLRAEAGADGWRLQGRADAVVLGPEVGPVIVPAETEHGVRFFCVDPTERGVGRIEGTATNYEHVANLAFDDVRVAADGALDPGLDEDWLEARASLCITALQLGVLSEGLRRASVFVGERRQFGRPIGSFQAVAVRLADCYTDVELLRSAAWELAWRLDAGLPALACARVAKFQASEAGHRVGHAIQHVHGGIGADLTYPIHRFFLWSRALELAGGGSERQLARLGDDLPVMSEME